MASPFGRARPQGAPRGILVYWMLHRISKKPTYGFEILREIEEKTEGAWRPGPGSVYPILKRFVRLGYVESERVKGVRADQRLYKITKKGADHIEEARGVFRTASSRWGSLRGIFTDLIEPGELPDFLIATTRRQFEMAKEIVGLSKSKIKERDVRSMLREYSQVLEAQQEWARRELGEAPLTRRRGA
jgi:DNA-binding PadR family transcriptional regulator